MTSERKVAVNRLNGRKSHGPRTVAGKSIASRNALRHGLAAITHRQPVSSNDIDRLAKALCGVDDDPSLFEQARVIANNELVLRAITEQQLAVVERVREPSAVAFVKGDNSIKLAKRRMLETRLAYDELIALREKLLEQYRDELPPPIVFDESLIPLHLEIFLQETEDTPGLLQCGEGRSSPVDEQIIERDESEVFEEAAADLLRLDRYERRACSRQRRAIKAFMNIKLMKHLSG